MDLAERGTPAPLVMEHFEVIEQLYSSHRSGRIDPCNALFTVEKKLLSRTVVTIATPA